MSNILVTGGLGFIGHNVVSKLESLGHTVTVTDTMTNYGIIPIDELLYLVGERKKKFKNVEILRFDICDILNIDWLFSTRKFDIVIHMASFPRQKVVNSDPVRSSRVMTEGLLNLCEASVSHGVKKFVYISSSMVYGDFTDNVKEEVLCNPQGQYGIMKLAGEHLVKDYARRKCFDCTILRPSAVYGPLDVTDRVVAKFMMAAIKNETLKVHGPNEKLDFTYVDDVAEGIVQATLSNRTNNKTYNITRGEAHTLEHAAKLVTEIAGQGQIETHNRDSNFPSRGMLNIDNAKNDFNFNPKVSIKDGFELYYNWIVDSDLIDT